MSKRIIFCADGTWDSKKDNTNVFKLFEALPQTADQVAFYDDGVGEEGNLIQRLEGAAFGHGLFQKVKNGYAKIASVYEPGDEIFIFGFSRGAYTARSIAGMISDCGLPTRNGDPALVDEVFDAYHHKEGAFEKLGLLTDHVLCRAPIKMVGVWDTVGSLGIPAIVGGIDTARYSFLDTNLHPNIQNAYQALALDEYRREFPPTLWKASSPPVPGQVLEQVWFAGAHEDVGGGYHETALSDISLGWMMDKAEKLGLQILPAISAKYKALRTDAAAAKTAALGEKHTSWSFWWGPTKKRDVPEGSTLSNSVLIRAAADASYRPKSLSFDAAGRPAASYQIAAVVASPAPAGTPVPAATPAPPKTGFQPAT